MDEAMPSYSYYSVTSGVQTLEVNEPNVECNEKAKAILWRQKKYGLSPHMLPEQPRHLRSSWS